MPFLDKFALMQSFLAQYDDLKRRLSNRLGSTDLANEALQDTWLRLEMGPPIGPVQQAKPYLLSMAYRIALNRVRRDRGTVSIEEFEEFFEIQDDRPNQERILIARDEIEQVKAAIAQLTPRQGRVLIGSRYEGIPLKILAREFGVTQRTIETDLQRAIFYCAQVLERQSLEKQVLEKKMPQHFGSALPNVSKVKGCG